MMAPPSPPLLVGVSVAADCLAGVRDSTGPGCGLSTTAAGRGAAAGSRTGSDRTGVALSLARTGAVTAAGAGITAAGAGLTATGVGVAATGAGVAATGAGVVTWRG